jgi:DNA-binding FadR family transcriptional regulator
MRLKMEVFVSHLFRKAKQSRMFQDVVEQIQGAILDGRIKPGDKLPAERELGEIFGTSRGTLREALRVLEHKGLIEIRVGVSGGAIVKDLGGEQMTESLALLIRSRKISLNHLAEFREDVESTVAGMAAKRATADDIQYLCDLLSRAETYWKAGVECFPEFIRIDEKIHMALASISGNPVYEVILRTVHANIHTYYDQFLPSGKGNMDENFQDLKQLVDAVSEGNAERAGKLTGDHIRKFNRFMEKKIQIHK